MHLGAAFNLNVRTLTDQPLINIEKKMLTPANFLLGARMLSQSPSSICNVMCAIGNKYRLEN